MNDKKVWLITGAGRGMGFDFVRTALAAGHAVVASGRDSERVSQALGQSNDLLVVKLDVTSRADADAAVRAAIERFGRIDVLVNNAGYSILGACEEISDKEVRANFDINVFAVLNMLRAVLPTMRAQGSGHVINIASISGSIGGATTSIYSATKAAVLLLSESLSDEVAEFGIRVTALCPGGFRTDFLDTGTSSRHPAHAIAAYGAVHQVLADYGRLNQHQGGDPVRAGEVMVELTRMDAPPTRLYIGADALRGIEYKLREVAEGVQRHQALSLSTGFRR